MIRYLARNHNKMTSALFSLLIQLALPAWIGGINVALANPSPKIQKLRLPSGSLILPISSAWQWHPSCQANDVSCYAGELKSVGTAYLFSGPLPSASARLAPQDLFKQIFAHQAKFATGQGKLTPKSFSLKKTPQGQTYCSWNRGDDWLYFWKAGKSLVTITFSPIAKSRSVNFPKEVQKLAQEIRIIEK